MQGDPVLTGGLRPEAGFPEAYHARSNAQPLCPSPAKQGESTGGRAGSRRFMGLGRGRAGNRGGGSGRGRGAGTGSSGPAGGGGNRACLPERHVQRTVPAHGGAEKNRDRLGSGPAERGNILDALYERSFAGLDPSTRVFVEDRLLTAGGFRGSVPVAETGRESIVLSDLESLVNSRLLRLEDRLGTTHVELSHDLLTPIVSKSRDERWAAAKAEAEREAEVGGRQSSLNCAGSAAVEGGWLALAL